MQYQLKHQYVIKGLDEHIKKPTNIRNIYRSEQQQLLSFDSVRPLGHNGTSKSVKVQIFPLALNAAEAGYVTARTPFKFLSFFRRTFTVRANTMYTAQIIITIVTVNIYSVQRFTKNCPFVYWQVWIRIRAWCWIFQRHQVPATTTNRTGIFQFLYTQRINSIRDSRNCSNTLLFWQS